MQGAWGALYVLFLGLCLHPLLPTFAAGFAECYCGDCLTDYGRRGAICPGTCKGDCWVGETALVNSQHQECCYDGWDRHRSYGATNCTANYVARTCVYNYFAADDWTCGGGGALHYCCCPKSVPTPPAPAPAPAPAGPTTAPASSPTSQYITSPNLVQTIPVPTVSSVISVCVFLRSQAPEFFICIYVYKVLSDKTLLFE
jgi:hypothetical protein